MTNLTSGTRLRVGWLLALLAATAVHAEDSTAPGFALSRFEPAGRGSRFFGSETLDWRKGPTLGLVGDYAYKPLVIYQVDGASQTEVATLAKHFALGYLGGTWAPIAPLRVGAELPVLLYGEGSPGQIGLVSYQAPRQTGVGDLRLLADWRFWGGASDPFRAGLGVKLFLPTGDRTAYQGEGTFRGTIQLQAAGEAFTWFGWAARFGFHLKGTDTTFAGGQIGSEMQAGLALGARLMDGRLTVGPELAAATTLKSAFSAGSTSVDLLVGAHYDISSQWRVGLGVGRGATVALGSPSFRGLLNVEWVPPTEEGCQPYKEQLAAQQALAAREAEARAQAEKAAAEARELKAA
ncbi:MAG: transporter, partial [Myxococcota bacterium]